MRGETQEVLKILETSTWLKKKRFNFTCLPLYFEKVLWIIVNDYNIQCAGTENYSETECH